MSRQLSYLCELHNAGNPVICAKCRMQATQLFVRNAKCRKPSYLCEMQNAGNPVICANCIMQATQLFVRNSECRQLSYLCELQNSKVYWQQKCSKRLTSRDFFKICESDGTWFLQLLAYSLHLTQENQASMLTSKRCLWEAKRVWKLTSEERGRTETSIVPYECHWAIYSDPLHFPGIKN